jgi:vacuolar-type H+-ATPase subunit D/Vma8
MMKHTPLLAAALLALTFSTGCQKAYYSTMEAFGKHKRDILVDRVTDARDAQNEAKEQFASALEEFTAVLNVPDSNLRKQYDTLKKAYDASAAKSEAVSSRISDVKKVAVALFKEWESELDQYSSENLRRSSEQKLRQTRGQYDQLIAAMERAESRIQPVLTALNDQVLYLKHNLNAQAIASLQNELVTVETDVASLIREMEKAIAEADAFISAMSAQP